MEEVVLVNEKDESIGRMEKMEAHEKGLLHRAISVFILNEKGEMLLQKRALHKYHSAGLWTNTCCSHPRPGEGTKMAAERRLFEEMGIKTSLIHKGQFIYKTEFGNGLTEFELDHVFTGIHSVNPELNPEEAADFCWKSVNDIRIDIKSNPNNYTSWFKIAIEKFFS